MKVFFLLLLIINNAFAKEDVKFHKPKTEAEKALDRILKIDANLPVDGIDKSKICMSMDTFISESGNKALRNEYNNKKCSQEAERLFKQFFTQALIDDATKQQDECNKNPKNCTEWDTGYVRISDGGYVSCAQDNPQNYLYYTIKIIGNKSHIGITWDVFAKDDESYYNDKSAKHPMPNRIMKYEDGHWKLDGICCPKSGVMINCHQSSNLASQDFGK